MAERKVGKRTLAEAADVSLSAVQFHRSGKILPRHAIAVCYAEALSSPDLLQLSLAGRERTCPIDGRSFVDDTGSGNRIYCRDGCRVIARKKRAGRPTRVSAVRHERRSALLQASIDAMCHGCEPDGFCWTVECALRPHSPLPLRERLESSLAVSKGNGSARGTRRAAVLKAWETRRAGLGL